MMMMLIADETLWQNKNSKEIEKSNIGFKERIYGIFLLLNQ